MNTRPGHRLKPLSLLVAAALLIAQPSLADERESMETLRETTLNLIDGLVEQGVFTREKADAMVKAAQAKAAKTAAAAAKTEKARNAGQVRVQYVPEVVKNEIREQLRQEVLAQARAERWAEPNAVPSWVDRIKWEGDVRVRYQSEIYDKTNTKPFDYGTAALSYSPIEATRAGALLNWSNSNGYTANTTEDRDRYRVRARLGMLARVSDDWSAGIRLATGSETDRVSTNQTLGKDFNKYQFFVDRAYINYAPTEWLNVSGGRIPNPWFSTDLMWDEDLSFEGFATTLKPQFGDGSVRPFLTLGAFPLREDSPPKQDSRWVFGVQAGTKWELAANTRLTLGAAFYDFKRLEGRKEDNNKYFAGDLSAYGQYEYGSGLRQKGNTLFLTNATSDISYLADPSKSLWGLASQFRPLNLTASLDLAHFDPVHVILTGDYIKNTAFDRSDIEKRTGLRLTDGKDYGYMFKMTVGMPKLEKRHDWQATVAYRYLGSDATLDAFTDSDFGLGGTNLKGYQLGFSYGLDPNAWFNLRWMSAQEIDSFSLDPNRDRYGMDLLQADINVRF